jgi:hypothetical protein
LLNDRPHTVGWLPKLRSWKHPEAGHPVKACAGYFVDPRVKACVIFNRGRRPKVLGQDAVMTRPMTRFDAPSRPARIAQMTRGSDK